MSNHFPYRWVIVLIFFLGLAFRFWLFFTEARFPGDTARDLLMGMHIVKYSEFPIIGHYASGNVFFYPPYYFYFHGLLYAIFHHPRIIIGLSVVWQSLSILVVYKIGKKLFDIQTGIVASLVVATAQCFVRQGSWMYSGPLATPLFLLSLLLFIQWLETKKMLLFVLSVVGLVVASFVSYAILIYLPAVLVIFLLIGEDQYGLKMTAKVFIIAMSSIGLFYGPLFFLDPIGSFLAFNPISFLGFNFQGFFRSYIVFISTIDSTFLSVSKLALYLSTAGAFFYFIRLPQKNKLATIYVIAATLLPVVLFAFRVDALPFSVHYFDAVIPLLVIIFCGMILSLVKASRNSIWRGGIIVALIIMLISAADNFRYRPYEANQFQQTETIAREIIRESERIKQKNNSDYNNFYRVFVYQQDQPSWINGPALWYQLERISGKKIVSLIPRADQFVQLNRDDIIFVYCLWYKAGPNDLRCQQDFQKDYPNHEFRYTMKMDLQTTFSVYQRKDSSIVL
jgi:4-amino-4-deoxy-L-arabinose transferase-like glycosyltransferase